LPGLLLAVAVAAVLLRRSLAEVEQGRNPLLAKTALAGLLGISSGRISTVLTGAFDRLESHIGATVPQSAGIVKVAEASGAAD
ncbi:MAG: hypothetical protein GY854_05875, partial [Deltaproteobacteria bacterium]|nr:hypothetical protein [Deltaproteobacteria bacterium]